MIRRTIPTIEGWGAVIINFDKVLCMSYLQGE